jgi:hypothetical protein
MDFSMMVNALFIKENLLLNVMLISGMIHIQFSGDGVRHNFVR